MDYNLFIDTERGNWYADGAENPFRRTYMVDVNHNINLSYSSLLNEIYNDNYERRARFDDYECNRQREIRAKLESFRKHIFYNNAPKRSRWDGVVCNRFIRVRNFMKMLGEAVRNEDLRAVTDLLTDIRSLDSDLAYRCCHNVNENLLDDQIEQCSDCGEYFTRDSMSFTVDDNLICEGCQDNYYWSDCQDVWIHEHDVRNVYGSVRAFENSDPTDHCTRRYGNQNYYEYDGNFFMDEDDRDEIRDQNEDDYDDDDPYEERRPPPDGLLPYHYASREFRVQNTGPEPALGVELEVYAEARGDTVEALRQIWSPEDLILERDGSLNDYHGFEIVTHPLGRAEWNIMADRLLGVLHEHKVIGYNEPAGNNYGIHITVDRRHLSPLAEARMSLFLSAAENQNFVRAIAQRNQIYGAEVDIGAITNPRVHSISHENQTIHHRNYEKSRRGVVQRKIWGRGKYCPINWKGNLAEFRIFQSTTHLPSFMKNLEFVWALHAWTKPESATGSSFKHQDFLTWLNTPEHRKDYPNLTDFLSKKVFYGTNFVPIISSWQNLMVKPVETHAMDPMAA